MLMYGWMVWVEHAPERYDWAVKVMTFGRIDRMKDLIAARVRPGDQVLDLGCGTGTLALRCIARGATVTGLDSSEFMLAEAARRAGEAGVSDQLALIRDSVTQTHRHLADASFDVVTATMALGEFPPEYLHYILRECARILRPGGKVLIGDECWPRSLAIRTLYRLAMVVFWIPQFLLLRRPLFPIKDLDGIIASAGFVPVDATVFPGTSFRLVHATKPAADAGTAPEQAVEPRSRTGALAGEA